MKKGILLLLGLFLLIVVLVTAISSILVGQRTSFFGKASQGVTDSEIATENSYVFASPLTAQAGDKERVRVTVFVLNGKGLGVPNKKVTLGGGGTLNVTEIQSATDTYGKALFDVTATNPGDYMIEAVVGSTILPQKVNVSFQ